MTWYLLQTSVCYEMFLYICVTGKLFFLKIHEFKYTVKRSIRLNRESRPGTKIAKIGWKSKWVQNAEKLLGARPRKSNKVYSRSFGTDSWGPREGMSQKIKPNFNGIIQIIKSRTKIYFFCIKEYWKKYTLRLCFNVFKYAWKFFCVLCLFVYRCVKGIRCFQLKPFHKVETTKNVFSKPAGADIAIKWRKKIGNLSNKFIIRLQNRNNCWELSWRNLFWKIWSVWPTSWLLSTKLFVEKRFKSEMFWTSHCYLNTQQKNRKNCSEVFYRKDVLSKIIKNFL